MRLLILTQAVDLDDPVLGFFHRWIEEIAARTDQVQIIALKVGRFSLPANVTVHSLGKESGRSRIKYVCNFYRYIWQLRGQYDSVFVHMNSEYVVLGGFWWRLAGKRIVLWRNHKMPGRSTSIGVRLAHTVCYTSPGAFVATFKNAVRMPIGIDTDFFSPGSELPRPNTALFLGRLDPVKHVEAFVHALKQLHERGVSFFADIVGDPTDPQSKYARDMRDLATPLVLANIAAMRPAVSNDAARDLFRSHALYVNLTPSGSFDKTIGEAMACGCLVVCANDALKGILPDALIAPDDRQVALAIQSALELSHEERLKIMKTSRDYVMREHSLKLLVEKITHLLAA